MYQVRGVATQGENMTMRVLLVLVVLVTFYGCGQSIPTPTQGENEAPEPSRPEVPADVPAYEVTKDEQGTLQGLRVRDMAASTDVTSEEGRGTAG